MPTSPGVAPPSGAASWNGTRRVCFIPLTRQRWISRIVSTALLVAALTCVALTPAQQSKRSKPRAKPPATPVAPPAAPVPFRSGEVLQYRVLFSKYAVNAARIETNIIEQRNFYGRSAWHFRATAHTTDTMRMLFPIDDQFDSYTAAANLFSLQYEMYLHEQGKDQTSVYRMTGDSDPAPSDATALRVTPGTRDAISFLYNLRAADWQRAPELRAPVFDGHRLYDAIARVDTPQGNVSVPAGNFPAFRVGIRVFDHGKELTDTRFWLWIALNAAHTPVLAEAEIPFGSARIELTQLP